MGVAVGVFSFITVLLAFTLPRLFRLLDSVAGVDLSSISVFVIALIASFAAGDARTTFGAAGGPKWSDTILFSTVLLVVYAMIFTGFEALAQHGLPYSAADFYGLLRIYVPVAVIIFIGVLFGSKRAAKRI